MEIREIKAQLGILEVLIHYSLKPDKNNMLCCPFHEDKTPSMQVYTETNTVFCFSSNCKLCGKAIDQIDFILHKENLTKHEAILKAQALLGHTPTQSTAMQTENLNDIFKKLQSALHQSKKAKAYLEDRNLYDLKLESGFNEDRIYKGLKNCVVFPLKDRNGSITLSVNTTVPVVSGFG